jgi:putative endonuclease
MNMANTKITGAQGEKIAAGYLAGKGYKILGKNYFLTVPHGPKIAEIDIIAKKRDCFAFVEVKTIKANSKFLAQDKVNEAKKWKIAKAAEMWLIKNKIPLNSKWQIDVIAIELLPDDRPGMIKKLLGPKFNLSHFENVSSY